MANEEHLKILKQGVEAWNEWREKTLQITPDLTGANLNKYYRLFFQKTNDTYILLAISTHTEILGR